MQRWNKQHMLDLAKQLFAKLQKRKATCNPNHDIHHLYPFIYVDENLHY